MMPSMRLDNGARSCGAEVSAPGVGGVALRAAVGPRDGCRSRRPMMMNTKDVLELRDAAAALVRVGGAVLKRHFGKVRDVRAKESWASVVSEADLESEARLTEWIERRFPGDGIVAEESGHRPGSTGRTWVIDPLDGTSNFVAGLPWFGVIVAVLEGEEPVASAMLLPLEDALYASAPGRGVERNGERVAMTGETDLRRLLIGYSFDPALGEAESRRQGLLLTRVAREVRNVRATNSMLDFLYTIDGRLGGCLNHATRIWDIAAAVQMCVEAGGLMTDLTGQPIRFELTPEGIARHFSILGASRAVHPQLVNLVRQTLAALPDS